MGYKQACTAVIAALAMTGLAGFDTSRHTIATEKILSGGPPKDGIPALSEPKFVAAGQADFLSDGDRVIGLVIEGKARAYPLRILNWHEIVNDEVGGRSVAVTYCPLTASGIVYDRTVGGKTLSFGVSGRLYQSNVLMYDRQTESLWSQLKEEGVTGSYAGTGLHSVPAVNTTWGAWRAQHRYTTVLSTETGYPRDYRRDPYAGYRTSPATMFPSGSGDRRLPAKSVVLGVHLGDKSKAYSLDSLRRALSVDDRLGKQPIRVLYDGDAKSAQVISRETGALLPGVMVYWFAWSAFHPDTELWNKPESGAASSARPRGTAQDSGAVKVTDHAAYWTEVLGLRGFGAEAMGGPGLLVIRGTLRNQSDHALDHVKLAYELLDAKGRVVASEEGFNRLSESLREIDSPVPISVPEEPPRPISGGSSDSFRMVFLRDETPPFLSYRVRVIEAPRQR